MAYPENSNTLYREWLLAWQTRCCPTDAVLTAQRTASLADHLDICPHCRRERKQGAPLINLSIPVVTGINKSFPEPGELWSVSTKLADWGPKKRYYNPPVVLIISIHSSLAATVVQVSDSILLKGPDDVVLDGNMTGIAQPWNRYTIHVDHLEHFLGNVSSACLKTIENVSNETFSPEPGSILWFFRNMEIETGWYFSIQSVQTLLDATGDNPIPSVLPEPTTLLEDLNKLPVTLRSGSFAQDAETLLAATLPADDLLPMAASDHTPQTISALLFAIRDSRAVGVSLLTGRITLQYLDNSILRISGVMDDPVPENGQWIMRWRDNSELVPPLPGQHGAEDGVFWAAFPLETDDRELQGEFIIRIVHAE